MEEEETWLKESGGTTRVRGGGGGVGRWKKLKWGWEEDNYKNQRAK